MTLQNPVCSQYLKVTLIFVQTSHITLLLVACPLKCLTYLLVLGIVLSGSSINNQNWCFRASLNLANQDQGHVHLVVLRSIHYKICGVYNSHFPSIVLTAT